MCWSAGVMIANKKISKITSQFSLFRCCKKYFYHLLKCHCHKRGNKMRRGDAQTEWQTSADHALPPSIKEASLDFHELIGYSTGKCIYCDYNLYLSILTFMSIYCVCCIYYLFIICVVIYYAWVFKVTTWLINYANCKWFFGSLWWTKLTQSNSLVNIIILV